MKTIAIVSPDAVRLPLVEGAPDTINENGETFLLKDKCTRSTATGIRAWNFAKQLSKQKDFEVVLFIPDLNYPGENYIDMTNLNFSIKSYNYKAAHHDWSEELDRKLKKYNFVIIQTTDGAGFKNGSVLPRSVNLIVDGWVPLLPETPSTLLRYHRIYRKFFWEDLITQYHDLLIRANCVLYANDRQHFYYEGQFFSIQKIGWKAFKFSPLLKVPLGIDMIKKKEFTKSDKKNKKLKLLWYGSTYPWYNPEVVLNKLGGHPNISVDFLGVEHPRYKRIYNSQFKQYFDNSSKFNNIKVLPHYLDNTKDLFIKYDATILITHNWLEEKYAHRARLFEPLSHGVSVIVNEGTSMKDELPFIKNNIITVNEDTLVKSLEDLAEDKSSLEMSWENYYKFHMSRSWEETIKPLVNYICNF